MKTKQALAELRQFIRKLHDDTSAQGSPPAEMPSVLFSRAGLGGLMLWGSDGEEYRKCVQSVWSPPKNPDDITISLKEAEGHVQVAILTALDPEGSQKGKPFDRRLAGVLSELKEKLRAVPVEWEVHLQVLGLSKSKSPTEFGGVEFYCVDDARLVRLGMGSPERSAQASPPAADLIREGMRAEVQGATYAKVVVNAVDHDAAYDLAKTRLRRTLDAVNFYSDLLSNGAKVYYPGEAAHHRHWWFALCKQDEAKGWHGGAWAGPFPAYSMAQIQSRAAPLGWSRVSQILNDARRSDLEERIMSAFGWAGRGTVSARNEQAFLFFAVSLEVLLLGPDVESELTHRLANRGAHLLLKDFAGRRELVADLKAIYRTRSRIVHSGSVIITEAEVGHIRFIAKSALVAVLTKEPFLSMQTSRQFDDWFEDQSLGEIAAETPPQSG